MRNGLEVHDAERLAELSCLAFLRIIAVTNKSPVLANYRLHQGLCALMPGYRVKMGFGLHRGWAIEGAIGSEFKVDASYLSPHVNLSGQLEAATKAGRVFGRFGFEAGNSTTRGTVVSKKISSILPGVLQIQ